MSEKHKRVMEELRAIQAGTTVRTESDEFVPSNGQTVRVIGKTKHSGKVGKVIDAKAGGRGFAMVSFDGTSSGYSFHTSDLEPADDADDEGMESRRRRTEDEIPPVSPDGGVLPNEGGEADAGNEPSIVEVPENVAASMGACMDIVVDLMPDIEVMRNGIEAHLAGDLDSPTAQMAGQAFEQAQALHSTMKEMMASVGLTVDGPEGGQNKSESRRRRTEAADQGKEIWNALSSQKRAEVLNDVGADEQDLEDLASKGYDDMMDAAKELYDPSLPKALKQALITGAESRQTKTLGSRFMEALRGR